MFYDLESLREVNSRYCGHPHSLTQSDVAVLPEDVKPTVQAVREAYDKYWADDDSVIGYGDAVKEAMDKLNCRYQLLLCDYNEYTDEPTEFWENLSDWIRWSMPTYEVKV